MKLATRAHEPASPPAAAEEPYPIAAFTCETDPPPSQKRPEKTWPSFGSWPSLGFWPSLGSWPSRPYVRRGAIALLCAAVVGIGGYVAFSQLHARAATGAAPPPEARLVVSSNPAGAEVLIDDVPRGVTPLSLTVPVGVHRLTVRAEGFSRDVQIEARANVELVQHVEVAVAAAPAVPAAPHPEPAPRALAVAVGTLIVTSPIDVELFQGDTLIGSSQSARLLLPAGRHTLTVVNQELGFSRAIPIQVAPGNTARLAIDLPNGTLSVNAQPWAEVFVDGKPLGETPIGNIALPIGSHRVVLRHPELGERSQTVVVGVGKPTRIGVDMRK